MGKYCKAYLIQQLRQFNNWTENQTGRINLVGNLTPNYEKVRCIAALDLQTLAG